jgi:hypothetical protein
MTLQIMLISLASIICFANVLLDLKTHYLYDLPNFISILITIYLFLTNLNQVTWQTLFNWTFINICFLIIYLFKILAWGDMKFIMTLSLLMAFINPILLNIFFSITIMILSMANLFKKYLLKDINPYPAGWIIFLGFLSTLKFQTFSLA